MKLIYGNYVGLVTSRRWTAGYNTFCGGNLVTWRIWKYNVVVWSSAESEVQPISQGIWIYKVENYLR